MMNNRVYLSKQRGFLAPVAFGAILVFSALSWMLVQQQMESAKDDAANQAGVYAAQFKHALQSKLSQDGVGIATGTFTGTDWLKDSATCTAGTGSMQHLPCAFPDAIAFGLSYSTTVSVAGGIATLQTSLGAPVYRGDVKPSIAGRIVSAINGANSAYSTPITQVYFVANHDLVTGAITMTVTNSQNLDYLKPDGSVFPTANFDWNNYNISNVNTLSANTVSANSLSGNSASITGSVSAGSVTASSYIFNSSVTVGTVCSGLQIRVDASGNPTSCVSGIWTASGGSEVFTRSLGVNIGNGSVYVHPAGETPLALTVSIYTYGGSNREGSAVVRWFNSSGALIRNYERISSTNEGNGNDGGSGMPDRELATIQFIPTAQRLQFSTYGSNSFSGRIISVMYKR